MELGREGSERGREEEEREGVRKKGREGRMEERWWEGGRIMLYQSRKKGRRNGEKGEEGGGER